MPDKNTETEWIKIADSAEELTFGPTGIAPFEWNDQKICIVKTPKGLKACADRCPHAGASLLQGFPDSQGNIECAVHHYKFNLTHGRDTQNEGYKLMVFELKENETGIYIKFPKA